MLRYIKHVLSLIIVTRYKQRILTAKPTKVNTMKKILIIGGTIFARNRGVAALVNGCVYSLRKNLANPKISLVHSFVESCYPTKTTHIEDINIVMDDEKNFVRVVRTALFRLFLATAWRLLYCLHINADFLLRDKLLTEYKKSDVVVNLSYGDIFAYRKNFYKVPVFYFILSKPASYFTWETPCFFSTVHWSFSRQVFQICSEIHT